MHSATDHGQARRAAYEALRGAALVARQYRAHQRHRLAPAALDLHFQPLRHGRARRQQYGTERVIIDISAAGPKATAATRNRQQYATERRNNDIELFRHRAARSAATPIMLKVLLDALSPRPTERRSNTRPPMMIVSKLLKSCAMPPVIWPQRFELLRLAQRLLGLPPCGHVEERGDRAAIGGRIVEDFDEMRPVHPGARPEWAGPPAARRYPKSPNRPAPAAIPASVAPRPISPSPTPSTRSERIVPDPQATVGDQPPPPPRAHCRERRWRQPLQYRRAAVGGGQQERARQQRHRRDGAAHDECRRQPLVAGFAAAEPWA